jgi:N-acyl homoserine lactone hydrolase|tara:strand:+ start:17810 stop:18565 length:756 start_codon:yes stop_codon:yes gene_type:complete
MKFLSGGRLKMSKRVFVPDATREEKIDLPVISTLIQYKNTNILFDTGCHPDVQYKPEKRWGNLSKIITSIGTSNDNLILNLKKNKITPTDIDLVINSHLHPDHCGCNQFFTNAEFICSSDELKIARSVDAESKGYIIKEWQHPMPLKEIKKNYDIFDDGRLITMPLPGHTPGSIGLHVNTDKNGQFILASDAVSIESNIRKDEIPKNAWNKDLLLNSYNDLRDLENKGYKLIYGHDDKQWQLLNKENKIYE